MTKYGDQIEDEHWEKTDEGNGEQWPEQTSADVEVEVTLHNEGYQTDRRWTVQISEDDDQGVIAPWAAEHQNKGNFWREPTLWRDAVDFEELPFAARKRVAAVFGETVAEITPEERLIHREDGSGVGDRAADHSGRCDVCGGRIYEDGETHEGCVGGGN